MSRSKRQLSKHCIRCENILKTKTRGGETDEEGGKHTKLGGENELIEREEPKRKQPKTITTETCLMRFGLTSSTWPEQASRDFEPNPAQPRPMSRRHTTMCRFPWRLQATPTSEVNKAQPASRGPIAASTRRVGQEITAFAGTNEEECGSPPTSPGQHQRYSGHHHHVFEPVAGQYVAARMLQNNLIAPLAGVLENPRKLH